MTVGNPSPLGHPLGVLLWGNHTVKGIVTLPYPAKCQPWEGGVLGGGSLGTCRGQPGPGGLHQDKNRRGLSSSRHDPTLPSVTL